MILFYSSAIFERSQTNRIDNSCFFFNKTRCFIQNAMITISGVCFFFFFTTHLRNVRSAAFALTVLRRKYVVHKIGSHDDGGVYCIGVVCRGIFAFAGRGDGLRRPTETTDGPRRVHPGDACRRPSGSHTPERPFGDRPRPSDFHSHTGVVRCARTVHVVRTPTRSAAP